MSSYLRPAAFISMILILTVLALFTNLSTDVLMSIALIMLFLIIFTYIFQTNGSKTLKVLIILFTFIGLPVFLLFYLKISWIISLIAVAMGIMSIILIIRLDEAEIRY